MNRLLIILFGIVSTLSVLTLLLLLYRYANENLSMSSQMEDGFTKRFDASKKSRSSESKWFKELATIKPSSYAYAVSEMEIDLPLQKKLKPKWAYRLILRELDDYKLFCLKQILKRNNLSFAMFRQDSEGVLIMKGLDENELDRIVKLVRHYNIVIKTEKYIKD